MIGRGFGHSQFRGQLKRFKTRRKIMSWIDEATEAREHAAEKRALRRGASEADASAAGQRAGEEWRAAYDRLKAREIKN